MSVGRSGPTSSCCQAGTPDMPEGPFDEEGIMSEVIEYPAPDLDFSSRPETPYERERRAFHELLPELLQTHFGQYVVIHDGKVVASGSDRVAVALEAFGGGTFPFTSVMSPTSPRGRREFPHRGSGEAGGLLDLR